VIPNGEPTDSQSLTVNFGGSGNQQANITITGAAPPSPTPWPSVNQWGLLGMAGVFAALILFGLGRRLRLGRGGAD
jgi:hypothetical protein